MDHARVYISGNSTFVGNSAQTGTVSLYHSAVVEISGNSNFTRNSASVRGGGMKKVYSDCKSCSVALSSLLVVFNSSICGYRM